MSCIDVHPKIQTHHPEIAQDDVVAAMKGMVRYRQRPEGEYIAVGFDGRGRFLELVYLYDARLDSFLVYHAMVPPSRKTLVELELERS